MSITIYVIIDLEYRASGSSASTPPTSSSGTCARA